MTNPVDLAGAGDRDPSSYARAVEALLGAEEVDGVLLTGYFGGYSAEPGGLHGLEVAAAEAIAAFVQAQDKPVVVHTIFPGSPTAEVLRSAGIPVHRDVDRACAVLGRARGATAAAEHDTTVPAAGAPGHRPVVRRREAGCSPRRASAFPAARPSALVTSSRRRSR